MPTAKDKSGERKPAKRKGSDGPASRVPASAGKAAELASDSAVAPTFPVVGVGASAGGLEAFTKLLKALPPKPGMAFVLIPHLDPARESSMADLLGRATTMPVTQVVDGTRVEPDQVYVLPPNQEMTIMQGALHLVTRTGPGRLHMPIDTFFRSLAAELRSSAIGVILSGTATDGSLGVAAIKNEGGFTFAEDPTSAKYDGMPNSAIASGCIDVILPPKGIAEELVRIGKHPYIARATAHTLEGTERAQAPYMAQIFRLLKQVCRVDFSGYKPATIRRRILRRMTLRRVQGLGPYVSILQQDRNEVEQLYRDILINVTSFFRDGEIFEALRSTVYPAILRGRAATDTIRLWVPGCSTGEEAYSHAIALLEYLSEVRSDVPVQIFATDLSTDAIRAARNGFYKESIAADVSPERLTRFFTRTQGGYQISKAVRAVCIFATQNVSSDPPFSHMDIVSCRNVLIYLGHVLQKRVIPVFHYALRPGGFLVIGNTEGLVGTGAELFEPMHKKHKLYRKKGVPSPVTFGMVGEKFDHQPSREVREEAAPMEQARTPVEIQREADRMLLTRYVPAAVVVSADLEILQTRGQASRYLELQPGKPTLNLMRMIKPGLLFEVRRIIEEAKQSGAPVRRENLQIEIKGEITPLTIEAIPFSAPPHEDRSVLLVFEEGTDGYPAAASAQPAVTPYEESAKDKLIVQLKQELSATKEYQQSIIEALEASNEELQSANEEIQSGNEELQSSNEELQTSKEELESSNEELNTVNDEMQHRNYLLAQLNADLINLLESVNLAIVMLSSDLSVRRFTPKAEELFGLGSSDVGRKLPHLKLSMEIPGFEQAMIQVMRDGQVRQSEFKHGKSYYRLRLAPYRTPENSIEGVVAVLFDISDFRPTTLQRSKVKKRR